LHIIHHVLYVQANWVISKITKYEAWFS